MITSVMPEQGSGAGQRTISIQRAALRAGSVHTLFLRFPRAQSDGSVADYQLEVVPGGMDEGRFWRLNKYLLRDSRTRPSLFRVLKEIQEREHFTLFICRYYTSLWAGSPRLGRTFVDLDDMPSFAGQRLSLVARLRWLLMERLLGRCSAVFVTKESDRRLVRHPYVRTLPCISTQAPPGRDDIPDPGTSGEEPGSMLFVGPSGHTPNAEGLGWFIRKVLPEIRSAIPSARLRIAGGGWETVDGAAGVERLGYVGAVGPLYSRAAVVVCPIWRGTGACVKLAEAAAAGKAIVTTPYAAAGFDGVLRPGVEVMVAESGRQMADLCTRVLRDEQLRRCFARKARSAAAQYLSQPAIDRLLQSAIAAGKCGHQ